MKDTDTRLILEALNEIFIINPEIVSLGAKRGTARRLQQLRESEQKPAIADSIPKPIVFRGPRTASMPVKLNIPQDVIDAILQDDTKSVTVLIEPLPDMSKEKEAVRNLLGITQPSDDTEPLPCPACGNLGNFSSALNYGCCNCKAWCESLESWNTFVRAVERRQTK